MYAQVIIDANHKEVDRVFDYRIAKEWENQLKIGVRVMVPFGQRNTKTEGYVIDIVQTTDVPENKLKTILEVLDDGKPVFTPSTLALAKWMQKTYFCTLNQCLQAIMPAGIRTKSIWFVESKCKSQDDIPTALSQNETAFLSFLLEQGGSIPMQEAEAQWGNHSKHLIQTLKQKGLLTLRQQTTRNTYKKEVRYVFLTDDLEAIAQLRQKAEHDKRLAGQCRILALLEQEGSMRIEDLQKKAAVSDSPIQTLYKKGILRIQKQEERRDVFQVSDYAQTTAFRPTPQQEQALHAIWQEWTAPNKRPVLLHGVTGSGKTEIYMQMIARVLQEGKQAIVLVPEISLTPQIMQRFISRFGSRVSVTHSRLSMGERLDQWKKARDGEISVMIGPRSALFMPFERLGMIVMDESHENSYYSDITPKYHTREVAAHLAKLTGALLLMGSATPDLESYYRAQNGEYRLVELTERTKGSHLPKSTIIDMRQELEAGNRSPFSKALQEAISENLQKKQQTMLFLNRRGYATFVSCRSCGEALVCPECNITYTYHAKENTLLCHYCGREAAVPQHCPACGSPYIRYFGTGTQKIEEEAQKLFPEARILRMDLDTTMRKGSHAQILETFAKGNADILVGTQMIAKGHDFPNVTLVGIMAADLSLHTGSYTAAETCFQLITQAAGRAGRDRLPGQVLIQTYQPESHAIQMAAIQDYKGFYDQEIALRRSMDYPPFTNIFSVLITGQKEQEVIEAAQRLGAMMQYYNQKVGFSILGPTPAALPKFRGEYRWRLFVKGTDAERLKSFVLYTVDKVKKEKRRKLHFHLAFNPQNLV